MVELNLDRLRPGRSSLPLDGKLVRADHRVHGHLIEGFETLVRGELVVDAMDQKVLVRGRFTAVRDMICDRSGQPFSMEYPVQVEVMILRNPHRGEDLSAEDDAWVIHQQGGIVHLDEALLEAVILDEPQHVVSPEYRDENRSLEGALPHDDESAEHDLVDPRWEALRKLRDPEADSSDRQE